MNRNDHLLQRLTDKADLAGEPLPGQTLVEIAGDNRILIENYCAIREYAPHKIDIRVKFGTVEVCGCGLELRRMTKAQLIITGKIDSVSLQRR